MTSSLASNVSVPSAQTTNIGSTIGGIQGGINSLSPYSSLGTSVLPYAQTTSNNLYNNPYAPQAQAGANQAAGIGQTAALGGYNTGGQIAGAGTSLLPYATSILNTAFDPQQALYNQQYALNQQQGAVNNAQAGVATTPYGAGLQDQSGQNFNIAWQNNLLNRMATGAQAADALTSTGANVAGQGVTMQNAAPGQLVQSATIPYATYSDIGQGQDTALSQLLGIGGQGANLSNMSVQDLLSLLGGQNQANTVGNQAAQTQLNQSNLAYNQLFGQYGLAPQAASVLGTFL